MNVSDKFEQAIQRFDEANSKDPNTEMAGGKSYPKELLYAQRMTDCLQQFEPEASEVLRLSVRCQHICRWEIPRDRYEMNRVGYLTWRQELKKFHAEKAAGILEESGYDATVIKQVSDLLLKKNLKKNRETQVVEDVVCLVFLEHYFLKFASKYAEDKLIDILQKTWKKMSDKGHEAALKLPLEPEALALVQKALN